MQLPFNKALAGSNRQVVLFIVRSVRTRGDIADVNSSDFSQIPLAEFNEVLCYMLLISVPDEILIDFLIVVNCVLSIVKSS